jgi:hypothetical protein
MSACPELAGDALSRRLLGGTVEAALETLTAALAGGWQVAPRGLSTMRAEWLAKAGRSGRGRRQAGRRAGARALRRHGRRGRLAAGYRSGPRRIVAGELLARAA